MSKEFDFGKIRSVEFGLCYDTRQGERFWQVPVNNDVQESLKEILDTTVAALAPGSSEMELYEPAQKYSATERLLAKHSDGYLTKLKSIHAAENFTVNANIIRDTDGLAYYFAVYRDEDKKKVVGVRRATQFKGVVKARNRLVALVNDSLELVSDNVFKLDTDFDYIIFDDKVWILRPTGFEYTAGIASEIASKAQEMIDEVSETIPCVNLSGLKSFVSTHKRAARLIASLRGRNDLHLTSASKLRKGCKTNGIQVSTKEGKIFPHDGHELAFLELLDRRRYIVELIDDNEELYVAPNRRGIAKAI